MPNKRLLTESPCVGVCSTTFGDDVCYGCQRTYLEVIQWNTLNDQEKDRINQRLALLEKKEIEP
ncbi:MAG: DUF1289 domain-containing protein [Gammaproteobacteria bacterium]|nr:DUF1289 domain-containing protein [Gammaproteobacteria bacterium]